MVIYIHYRIKSKVLQEHSLNKLKKWRNEVKSINIDVYPIEIKFNLKSKSSLGTIRYKDTSRKSFLIRLSAKLYEDYKEEYIDFVLKHEFAHACVMSHYRHRCRPHGVEWKNIMRFLGEAKPRASTNKFQIQKSGHKWICSCSEYVFGKIKHKNALKKKNYINFFCRKCKEKLFYSGECI